MILAVVFVSGTLLAQSSGTLVAQSMGSLLAQAPPKVKVLILTGVNNHKWAATTPVLRELLEQTGQFEVRVNEEGRGNGPETFAPYDVLLLNYNDMKHTAGPWWDDRARQACSTSCGTARDWFATTPPTTLSGGGMNSISWWAAPGARPPATGPYHAYTVKIVDPENPVTKGMPASFAERTNSITACPCSRISIFWPRPSTIRTTAGNPAGLRHGKR